MTSQTGYITESINKDLNRTFSKDTTLSASLISTSLKTGKDKDDLLKRDENILSNCSETFWNDSQIQRNNLKSILSFHQSKNRDSVKKWSGLSEINPSVIDQTQMEPGKSNRYGKKGDQQNLHL